MKYKNIFDEFYKKTKTQLHRCKQGLDFTLKVAYASCVWYTVCLTIDFMRYVF